MDNTLAQIVMELWRAQQVIVELQQTQQKATQERDALKAEVERLSVLAWQTKPEGPLG